VQDVRHHVDIGLRHGLEEVAADGRDAVGQTGLGDPLAGAVDDAGQVEDDAPTLGGAADQLQQDVAVGAAEVGDGPALGQLVGVERASRRTLP
jgi:hypothetical protein